MPLRDGNVKRPGVGVMVGLALLAVQAGPHHPNLEETRHWEESLPECEILCNVPIFHLEKNVLLVLCWHNRPEITCGNLTN
jgi:hypothetical protein